MSHPSPRESKVPKLTILFHFDSITNCCEIIYDCEEKTFGFPAIVLEDECTPQRLDRRSSQDRRISKLRTVEITIAVLEKLMIEVIGSHAINMKKEFNNS